MRGGAAVVRGGEGGERRPKSDFGSRYRRRCGFEPSEPDAETADAFGVGRPQLFVFGASQAQCLSRGGRFAEAVAVAFDLGGEGRLVWPRRLTSARWRR